MGFWKIANDRGDVFAPRPGRCSLRLPISTAGVEYSALVAITFLLEGRTWAHLNKRHFYTKLGFCIRAPLLIETPEELLASKWNDALVSTVCK